MWGLFDQEGEQFSAASDDLASTTPPTSTQLRWFGMSWTTEWRKSSQQVHMWEILQDCWKIKWSDGDVDILGTQIPQERNDLTPINLYRKLAKIDMILLPWKGKYLSICKMLRSDLLFPLFCLYLVWSGRELGWAVYVCVSMFFLFLCLAWYGSQRQLFIVVPDWEPYLGSLDFTVGLWVFVSVCVFGATRYWFG